MISRKTSVALVIGAVIFAVGFVGGFMIQPYLGTRSSTQSSSSNLESLTIESYTPRLLTQFAVEFTLENSGTTDIQITDVTLNGYSNQTTNGMNQGWNGTTFLYPSQTGVLYVYAPSYASVINQTMPQLSTNPTQTELENFETWAYYYNSTFTFITSTAHQYNCTIPGLGFELAYAITTWAASSTTNTFMGSASLTITNVIFADVNGVANQGSGVATNTVILAVKNTGTKTVTVGSVKINNILASILTTNSTTTYSAGTTGQIEISNVDWSNGNPYMFNLFDTSGNGVGSYQANSPGS
jgi:hypothetical protein